MTILYRNEIRTANPDSIRELILLLDNSKTKDFLLETWSIKIFS